MKDKKIMPVTIITGFLGSGKTTLMNEILKHHTDTNFLIIENEFGKINIDGDLLKSNNRNKIFEFTSGCICCSLSTELGTLLNSLILSNVQYDYVLIEATGIADPGQIIQMFTGDRVQRYFRLDSVVCMVDSESFLNRVTQFHEAYMQIAQSDMVLINKSDLIPAEKMDEVEQKVASINPFAKTEKTVYGRLKENKILNSELFQASRLEKSVIDFNNPVSAKPSNKNTHQIQTLSYKIPGYFNMKKLSVWLEYFLTLNANSILRIKGILSIEDIEHKIIIQSVGTGYHTSQGTQWNKDEDRESKIIIIGTDLKNDEIEQNLHSFLIMQERKDNNEFEILRSR